MADDAVAAALLDLACMKDIIAFEISGGTVREGIGGVVAVASWDIFAESESEFDFVTRNASVGFVITGSKGTAGGGSALFAFACPSWSSSGWLSSAFVFAVSAMRNASPAAAGDT